MHKIDLITGFLGSGKTTFIKKYAEYLIGRGERIGILENDFGAINVDRVLLSDILGDNCGIEMVVGGDTQDTHRRRMKTKLIALAMNGYDRVIIEPSGIFDVDELFDLLYEEPLDRMYEMGAVITIVDAGIGDLSGESRYLMCSQTACAGRIILSKMDMMARDGIGSALDGEEGRVGSETIKRDLDLLNNCLTEFKCKRVIDTEDIFPADLNDLNDADLAGLAECGYNRFSHIKMPVMDTGHYESLFVYHLELDHEDLVSRIRGIFTDDRCGHIFRIKGYMNTTDRGWLEINATSEAFLGISETEESENVIIIIGENVDKEAVRRFLPVQ